MTATSLATEIVRTASRFIGLREVKPNANWDNPATPGPDTVLVGTLRSMMRSSPWEEGWAYCAAFCEGVVADALVSCGATPQQVAKWHKIMTPHCVTSAGNFRERGLLSQVPEPGSIWLARHGTSSNGHAGIVTAVRSATMSNIEANTSLDPSTPAKEREGDWITTRIRPKGGVGSLKTMGFVTPASIIKAIQ